MKKKIFILSLIMFALTLNKISSQIWQPNTGRLYTSPLSTKVGIGISTNTEEFHVKDFSGNNYIQAIFQGVNSSGGIKLINDGSQSWEIQSAASDAGSNTANDLIIYDRTHGRYVLTLNNDNGNVGIGQTNPQVKLDVNGSIKASDYTEINTDNNNPLRFYNSDGDYQYISFNTSGIPVARKGWVGIDDLNNLKFCAEAGDAKVVSTNGSIIIWGDNIIVSESGKLTCDEIEVRAMGADYVFEENYNLPTLDEVEAFIIENNHLPDVPSAAEMEAKGSNVAEMDQMLLQKIEELTLYMIDLKKENELLKVKFGNLENR